MFEEKSYAVENQFIFNCLNIEAHGMVDCKCHTKEEFADVVAFAVGGMHAHLTSEAAANAFFPVLVDAYDAYSKLSNMTWSKQLLVDVIYLAARAGRAYASGAATSDAAGGHRLRRRARHPARPCGAHPLPCI